MTEQAQLPDGTILEFPDGTPEEVIDQTVQREIQNNQQSSQQPTANQGGEQADVLKGSTEALMQGATFGFSDELQALLAAAFASPFVKDKTFSQLMVDARESIREEYQQFREQNPKKALALEVTGGFAVPGGIFAKTEKGSELVRSAKAGLDVTKNTTKAGAAAGAVAGAGFADADDFLSIETALSSAMGTGAGALIGRFAPKAIGALTSQFHRLTGKSQVQVFDDSGKFTNEAIEELRNMVDSGQATPEDINMIMGEALRKEGILSAEQAERFNLFREVGVTPNRANVTQSTDDFKDLQSSLKREGPVSRQVAQQDEELITAVESKLDKIGPTAQDLPSVNAEVKSVVDTVAEEFDTAVHKAYQTARTEAAGQPRVTINKFVDTINDHRGSDKLSGGIIRAVRGILKNKGLLKKGTFLAPEKGGARATGEGFKKITVEEAEEIRKTLNRMWKSATPEGKYIIGRLKVALDDDVIEAVGEDIFTDARAAKIRFENLIKKSKQNKFDDSKKGFLEKVLHNEIDEKDIVPKLLRSRDDDFLKFKQFLTQDAGKSGQQAWNDIKAQVVRDALEAATSTQGKGEGGQVVFNASKFWKKLEPLTKNKKYKELFDEEERKFLEGVRQVGFLRVPQRGVALGGGPSEEAIKELNREILKRIPFGERFSDLTNVIKNAKTDRRLLDVTTPTEKALQTKFKIEQPSSKFRQGVMRFKHKDDAPGDATVSKGTGKEILDELSDTLSTMFEDESPEFTTKIMKRADEALSQGKAFKETIGDLEIDIRPISVVDKK